MDKNIYTFTKLRYFVSNELLEKKRIKNLKSFDVLYWREYQTNPKCSNSLCHVRGIINPKQCTRNHVVLSHVELYETRQRADLTRAENIALLL